MNVAGVVLAAGAASRYGRPKVLERFGGHTLLEHVCRALGEAGCEPVVVVLGAHADEIRRTARLPSTVFNVEWRSGMASSLRTGLAALPSHVTAAVVALADQPLVGAEVVRRLVAAGRDGAQAAVATYGGRPRNPVLLARSVFAEVAASVHGDKGAREWLRSHPDRVVPVPCDDAGDPFDIDTPADLARLVRESGSEASRQECRTEPSPRREEG